MRKTTQAIALATLLVATAGFGRASGAPGPEAGAPKTILIKNANILTVSHGKIENGAILIRDGKIAAVGAKVDAPADARVVDAGGQRVMPGIIDPHSHINADSTNEGSIAVSSMTRTCDVINPESMAMYRELAGGVTTADIIHGSANPIGGLDCVLKFRWGKTAKEMMFEGAKPAIKFALGENPKRAGTPSGYGATTTTLRYPGSRMGTEDVIRQAFTEARQYVKDWDEYKGRAAGGEKDLAPPRKDLKLEPLAEVLRGERYVYAHGYRADELLMLLKIGDEFGFKIRMFIHGLEAYKIADEIAAHGTAVTTFSDWWAYKVEAWDAIPYNAAILAKKGVLVSLNSDDAELARHLNQEAAKLLKYGNFTDDEALATITLNPAKQLGIDGRVGSIDVGKDADLAIFDQHPLSNYAKVAKVFIDGQVYFDREQDLKQREATAKEIQELKEKERKALERRPAAAAEKAAPPTTAPPSGRKKRPPETTRQEVIQ
jgi:imidazolonepropionase-like amidohydrolase